MMRVLKGVSRAIAAVAVVAVVMAFGAVSASAAGTPSWAITTGSDPTAAAVPQPAATNATFVIKKVYVPEPGELSLTMYSPEYALPGASLSEKVLRTVTVPSNAAPAAMQADLEAAIGAGNVKVTGTAGTEYTLEFVGELTASPIEIKNLKGYLAVKAKSPGLETLKETAKGQGLSTRLTATAVNIGATTSGTVTVTEPVPAGFVPSRASGQEMLGRSTLVHEAGENRVGPAFTPADCHVSSGVATCTLDVPIAAGDGLEMKIYGYPEATATSLAAEATVSGGGAEAHASATIPVGGEVPFGIEPGSLMFGVSGAGAGGHPNLTTGFTLDQSAIGTPVGLARTIELKLPAGVIGDPQVTGTCTMAEVNNEECPAQDAVGVAQVTVANDLDRSQSAPTTALVYNVAPNANEPAAFGFNAGFPVRLDTHVGPQGEYRVKVHVEDVTSVEQLISTYVTLWGVPAEHNGSTPQQVEGEVGGTKYVLAGSGPYMDGHKQGYGAARQGQHTAFLDYPTQCSTPLSGSFGIVSWGEYSGGKPVSDAPAAEALTLPTPTECGLSQFSPQVEVQTTNEQAGSPAGYAVHLKVPQNESAEGSSTPEVKDVKVEMPEGTVISPSAAKGLGSCSNAQFAAKADGKGNCPSSSNIGNVKITTPLLALPLEGNVYVGQPECAPCTSTQAQEGKMVRLFLEAEGSGVTLKLAGRTEIEPGTGKLTTVFEKTPQLPFSDLELSLKGGQDAPLVNPSSCGNAISVAHITSWASALATEVRAPAIPISGCKAAGFAPSLEAGMTGSGQGGAFGAFAVTLSRPDGQQSLGSVSVNMPPGMEAILNGVPRCPEAEANAGTCSAASQIGTTTTVIGPGSAPYTIEGGKVYLTEGYDGAPFGLSIVTPAKAGPFTLGGQNGQGRPSTSGTVVIRASISVNPQTAAITIATGKLPTELDGIPLSIDRVIVNVNRPGFMFNPTNCNAMAVTGAIESSSGALADVSFPFQSHGCASLPFKPSFNVLTHAGHSRRNGAYMHVVVRSGAGQANIHKVDVELPRAFSVRDETLKQSCTEQQYAANPAGCPAGSIVGHARASTPILTKPLEGPAYFVSHAGKEFPNLDVVLQGEGVTIQLTGNTYVSKKGYTFSKFESVPDAPISRFDLVLPEGPHSALAGNGGFCKHKLVMPTSITGQNGAQIEEKTKLQVTGCGPRFFVRKKRVHGDRATIVLHVPYAGRLVANGKGISKVSKRIRKHGGRMAITVKLKRHFRRQLRHSRRHRMKVTVHLRFSSHHHKALKGHVKVRLK